MALLKNLRLTESKSLQFRLEAFNVFNHAQFFGPQAVDGNISSAHLRPGGKRRRSPAGAIRREIHILKGQISMKYRIDAL